MGSRPIWWGKCRADKWPGKKRCPEPRDWCDLPLQEGQTGVQLGNPTTWGVENQERLGPRHPPGRERDECHLGPPVPFCAPWRPCTPHINHHQANTGSQQRSQMIGNTFKTALFHWQTGPFLLNSGLKTFYISVLFTRYHSHSYLCKPRNLGLSYLSQPTGRKRVPEKESLFEFCFVLFLNAIKQG